MNENLVIRALIQLGSSFFRPAPRQERIRQILEAAIRITSADRGTVFMVDGKHSVGSLVATGLDGEPIQVDVSEGVVGSIIRTEQAILINDAKADARYNPEVDKKTQYDTRQILGVPIHNSHYQIQGAIEVLNSKRGAFSEEDLQLLRVVSIFTSLALELEDKTQRLHLHEDAPKLKSKRPNVLLQSSYPEVQRVFDRLEEYGKSDASVLVLGESGTGKEGVARLLHHHSERSAGPFVALNCAAIPESLFEAELFGVAEGAATGTVARKGKIELAHEGTLFLDEVGDLPLSLQAKLLRALEDHVVTRVGSESQEVRSDFRLVCATHRDLRAAVEAGDFRDDLYYRINVVQMELPALRDRPNDLGSIAEFVLERLCRERGIEKTIGPDAKEALAHHPWPGNIRELRNKLEFALIQSRGRDEIQARDFEFHVKRPPATISVLPAARSIPTRSLRDARAHFERQYAEQAVRACNGNKSKAARMLGISRETLRQILGSRAVSFQKAA